MALKRGWSRTPLVAHRKLSFVDRTQGHGMVKTAARTKTKRAKGIPDACCTLRIKGRKQERLVDMFKALGNPIRFEILKFLLTHPGCITGDIVDELPIAQATVSQHLKVLREAGLIQGMTEGKAVCYCLDPDAIAWFKSVVSENF